MTYRIASNVSTFTDMFHYANEVTGSWFGIIFLFLVFMFFTITTYPKYGSKSLVGGLFMTSLLAFLMSTGGLIPGEFVPILLIGLFGAIIYMARKG